MTKKNNSLKKQCRNGKFTNSKKSHFQTKRDFQARHERKKKMTYLLPVNVTKRKRYRWTGLSRNSKGQGKSNESSESGIQFVKTISKK